MKSSPLYLRSAICLVSALYLKCGSLNNVPLAGGSGAGNPGGTVSVALAIFTDTIQTKTTIAIDTAANDTVAAANSSNKAQPSLVVKDLSGLAITIASVNLNSSDLRLVLDDREESHCVLDSFKERPSYLSSDSQSLVINKQFSFDAFHGTPDSMVPPVIMPVSRYTGVQLNFNQAPSTSTDTGWKSKIHITGSFMYHGLNQDFTVEISRTFSPYYKFAGGIFTLSATDTTHLELRFNASQWFRRVNFKQALDQGVLTFNPKNAIVISSNSFEPGVQDIEYHIKTDFINSGKLAVY